MTYKIPAILVLGSKTYGKKGSGNNVKYYYKCFPDYKFCKDNGISGDPLLVPFKPNLKQFSKKMRNKFIIIECLINEKLLKFQKTFETIGSVDDFNSFCKYQMYCRDLFRPLWKPKQFKIKQNDLIESFKDNRDRSVYTIDPKNSKDFDDAFSIQETDEGVVVSVYITNVPVWLTLLDLGEFDLTSAISRVATTYFPTYNEPMLPRKLSEKLCSLVKDQNSIVLTLDYNLKTKEVHLYNSLVIVNINLAYSDDHEVIDKLVKEVTKITGNKNDSHSAVAYFMAFFNKHCAKVLRDNNEGIFRICPTKPTEVEEDIDPKLREFLSYFSSGSKYSTEPGRHEMLDTDQYVNITSPIRRLVDLLNMIKIQKVLGIFETDLTDKFYDSWIVRLDYLNKQHKSINKIQTETKLLNLCLKNENKVYKGFPISKELIKDSDEIKYTVYLPEIKMVTNMNMKSKLHLDIYQKYQFKIFVFEDESTFRRKVKLSLE
jgi:hypothetical protein